MPVLLLDDFCDILYVLQYSVGTYFEMFLEMQGVWGILFLRSFSFSSFYFFIITELKLLNLDVIHEFWFFLLVKF